MSETEYGNQDAWKEAFFDEHERSTPAADYQPGWQLTVVGITAGLMALLMLSI